MVRSVLHHHGESEGLLTQTQSVCQDRSQPSVYWTITVKVKDYSLRHEVFVVRTEVINTQYIEQSGWKWRTTHTQSVCCQNRSQPSVYWTIRVKMKDYSHTKCLLSEQKSTLRILNNQGESEGLLTRTQSVCCQNRSQHSVYRTIRVKVKDYSRRHKVGVVWTEVNTQDPGAVTGQCSSQVGVLSEKEEKHTFLWLLATEWSSGDVYAGLRDKAGSNPILAVGP